MEASPELVYAAAALDPLTSALLTLPQIREMVDRLFEAERPWPGELVAQGTMAGTEEWRRNDP